MGTGNNKIGNREQQRLGTGNTLGKEKGTTKVGNRKQQRLRTGNNRGKNRKLW